METSLKGKAAIVTGASRGIGLAIADMLAEEKVDLTLTCRTMTDELISLKEKAIQNGSKVFIYQKDLTEKNTANEIIESTIREFGKLDILINNAGMAVAEALENTSDELWDKHMNLNARVPFMLCREAIQYLKASDCASIINISSVVGIKGYKNQGAYTASKHALMGMTKVLAQEVAGYGIRVHTLCPGGVETDMVTKTRPDLDRSVLIAPSEISDIVKFILTHRGNAMVDDIHIRRISNDPWY